MPNYVTNVVYAKDVKALKKFTKMENGERVFDFNKIIPMPKDLHITSGSMSYIDNDFGFDKEKHARQTKVIDPLLNKFYTPKITQNKFLSAVKKEWNKIKDNFETVYNFKSSKFEEYDTIIKGYFNTQRYGYKDWYSWSIDKWGTKWNASSTRIFDKGIQFDTAWSCPVSVLKELSKHTPIVVSFSDEDTGRNYGIYEFNNGKSKVILNDKNHMAGEALACRGSDEEGVCDYFAGDWYSDEEIEEYFGGTREEVTERHIKYFNKVEKKLSKALEKLGGKNE